MRNSRDRLNKSYKRRPIQLGIALLLLILVSGSMFLLMKRIVDGKSNAEADTRQPSPTATATPSPSPTPTETVVVNTPELLYSEDFADGAKGWYLSDRAGYTRTFANGELILQATNHKTLVESLPNPRVKSFDNFTVTVDFTLYAGNTHDSVGLYLRGDSNLDHDYRLNIYGDNTYAISKEVLGEDNTPQSSFLAGPDHTPQLKPLGQQNTLTMLLQGSTIALLINDRPVTTVSDADYTQGQVSLFVTHGPSSSGVTAAFSRIEIYSAPLSSIPQN